MKKHTALRWRRLVACDLAGESPAPLLFRFVEGHFDRTVIESGDANRLWSGRLGSACGRSLWRRCRRLGRLRFLNQFLQLALVESQGKLHLRAFRGDLDLLDHLGGLRGRALA